MTTLITTPVNPDVTIEIKSHRGIFGYRLFRSGKIVARSTDFRSFDTAKRAAIACTATL